MTYTWFLASFGRSFSRFFGRLMWRNHNVISELMGSFGRSCYLLMFFVSSLMGRDVYGVYIIKFCKKKLISRCWGIGVLRNALVFSAFTPLCSGD